jgi:hypothetical protein
MLNVTFDTAQSSESEKEKTPQIHEGSDDVMYDFNFQYEEPDQCHVITANSQHSTARNETNVTRELLHIHERYAHLSFKCLQAFAKVGIIPKRLATCDIPLCPSCLYGKMSRRRWWTGKEYRLILPATKPGQVVSVDQMDSSTPGLIAQLKGIPARFVDHATNHTFVHLQQSNDATETLRAKHEYERIARSHGITIKQYHADNGRLVDNKWWEDALKQGQQMTMCGVNAHHQNGKVERRIRELSDLARSSLLQTSNLWTNAITP